jgi:hypothetical protein
MGYGVQVASVSRSAAGEEREHEHGQDEQHDEREQPA